MKGGKKNSAAGAQNNMGAQRSSFSFSSYIFFFVAVAATATVSILGYELIFILTQSKLAAAIGTAVILIVLSVVLTLISAVYRRAEAERPVKEILRATDRMARGDFKINLKPRHMWGKYDEYDVIFENINRMAAEL